MYVRFLYESQYLYLREVTDMSEMPCRLIDGLHEWCNEISTVPS